ncbi:MAG: hypothetical protein WCR72_15960 [Bacteroidota bacterium]
METYPFKHYAIYKWLRFFSIISIAPFAWLFKTLALQFFKFRLELKVREALRLSKLENRRYIVTTFFDKPMCLPKGDLKQAVKRRKFKKGVTIQDIEKSAYFITK